MTNTYRCRASFSFAGVLRLAVSIGVAVERPRESLYAGGVGRTGLEGGSPELVDVEAALPEAPAAFCEPTPRGMVVSPPRDR